ncbi:iron-siderophore ABC transporter substrate-binding protein [Paenibacillus sp. HB172176]|uniref:ABC transporter substrate-binding protein n=1 Tax=Paenibacillus sp. HB172176 TaxID=2493690 RepID=UPI001F0D702B|nr:iron-siderophore ABC transporter substrate-binding protein [Paenibacillus sp. HB172176]
MLNQSKLQKFYIRTGMVMLTAVFMLILAACGQSNETNEGERNTEQATSETAGAGSEESDQNLVLEGSFEDVTLPAPAKRVVALEWKYAEELITLGLQPVGVADIEGYNKWMTVESQLGSEVVDVGTRQEPSLEEIAALEPDLIIAPQTRHEAIIKELQAIAPTVLFNPYQDENGPDQYSEMEQTFRTIAKAVGKTEEGEEALDHLQQKYDAAAKIIEESDLKSREFVLASAYSSQNTPTLRIFTDNGMATQILEKIGLENKYHSDAFEIYGYTQTTVEALPELEEANFLYIVQDDDNVFENQLKDNPVWTNLAFVKEDRTYSLGADTWMYGGPLSAEVLVDKVLKTMVNK